MTEHELLAKEVAELRERLQALESKLHLYSPEQHDAQRSLCKPARSNNVNANGHSQGLEGNGGMQPMQPVPRSIPMLDGVPMAATRVVMHQIVMPAEVDILGICRGGQVSCACPTSDVITCVGSRPLLHCTVWAAQCSCATNA